MEQKFHPYYEWEDYQSGMYDELKQGREQRIELAMFLLSNSKSLEYFMKEVTIRWKLATEQNFTNVHFNRKSWLGQAACNLFAGVKEDETRSAWWKITDVERKQANAIADLIIKEWVKSYEEVSRVECVGGGAKTDRVDV